MINNAIEVTKRVIPPVPRVAVLLASFNGELYIKEQIMSILDQEGVFIDLFISDDFSSDLTVNIIKKINKKNIILLRPKSRLGSPSKNFFNLISSVDIAKYDFFSFSDQDDIWFKDKIFKAIKLLNKIKASGYSSNFTAMWENGKKINFRKDYNQKKFDYIFESAGPGCSYLIRKDLFLELQVFTKINSDKLFFITALFFYKVLFISSVYCTTGVGKTKTRIEKRN
jgi:rhamnosyltransferase